MVLVILDVNGFGVRARKVKPKDLNPQKSHRALDMQKTRELTMSFQRDFYTMAVIIR